MKTLKQEWKEALSCKGNVIMYIIMIVICVFALYKAVNGQMKKTIKCLDARFSCKNVNSTKCVNAGLGFECEFYEQ